MVLRRAPPSEDEGSSFSSTSTMDSDYEIPVALQRLHVWSNERVSTKVSQALNTMNTIRESESMRFSMVTANKWKKMGYHPYKPDASGYTALHRAAKRGDEAVVASLLAMYDGKAIDLASIQSYKQQQIALHIAAKYGNLEAARLLAEPEFRELVNMPDRNGNTPLHFAATCSAPSASDVVALLLLRGADPTIKSKRDVFPIIAHVLTAQDDDPEIGLWKVAAALVREHAGMTIRNNQGVMVLDILSPPQLAWLAKFIIHPPEWVPYETQRSCMVCSRKFGLLVRRHHCRLCGRICCGPCSKYKRRLPFTDMSIKPTSKGRDQMMKVCSTCITVREVVNEDLSWRTATADRLIASDAVIDYDDDF
ncbi:FYVE zinc finger domain-containing protein [Phytophthora infestans]|uniref:FYVE zinc finger domain-containing protein n=1 Tax=Phytophthora infestans TaxID=4787 RepID=A0A833S1L9_PHYIN|nr:FYVE zinc finger domain-containing protein [Phytophthora infestans]